MAITLQDLRDEVNRSLRNHLEVQRAEATGDGVQTEYKLPDENIIEVDSCTVGGAAVTESADSTPAAGEYYLDYDSGWMLFGAAPALNADVVWQYTFRKFTDQAVDDAINFGIDSCYENFYIDKIYTGHTASYSTYEYAVPGDCERIISIDVYNGYSYHRLYDWRTLRKKIVYSVPGTTTNYLGDTTSTTLDLSTGYGSYVAVGDYLKDEAGSEVVYVSEIASDALTVTRASMSTVAAAHDASATWRLWDHKYVQFFNELPYEKGIRIHYISRPIPLANATDTLEYTAGLPSRAKNAVIQYAISNLLSSKGNMRVMDDSARNTQGQNSTWPRDIEAAAQRARLNAEFFLSKERMHPRMYRWHS